ncbi:MAG: hypothetical protein MHMPM18_000436 [Marteilia pararefringens]
MKFKDKLRGSLSKNHQDELLSLVLEISLKLMELFKKFIRSDPEEHVHRQALETRYLKDKVYAQKPATAVQLRTTFESECTNISKELFHDVGHSIPSLRVDSSVWSRTDNSLRICDNRSKTKSTIRREKYLKHQILRQSHLGNSNQSVIEGQ